MGDRTKDHAMTTQAYDLSGPAQPPAIRADQPTVVEIGPEIREVLIAAAGAIVMALVGVLFASYLMLPFGG